MIRRPMEVGERSLRVIFGGSCKAIERLCSGIEACFGFGHNEEQLTLLLLMLFLSGSAWQVQDRTSAFTTRPINLVHRRVYR